MGVVLGLNRDNGKSNGNYNLGSILLLLLFTSIVCRDNGKQNGNYYGILGNIGAIIGLLRLRVSGP